MKQRDIQILDDLLVRTDNLPDILHLRAAEIGYELTDDDKKLLLDTYQKLDDILKEVAAFINVKFPKREDYVYGWNKIDFDTKIGNFKIATTDREHTRRAWRDGIFDLKNLLKSLRTEVILIVGDNEEVTKTVEKKSLANKGLSWIETLSWIAGIIGTILTLYALLR